MKISDGVPRLLTHRIAVVCVAAAFAFMSLSGECRASTLTILFYFGGDAGASPTSNLLADAKGNLYGTTTGGGLQELGTVFELSPPASGSGLWNEQIILEDQDPRAGLIADAHGSLYGTTYQSAGYGTAFEMDPPTSGTGSWKYTTLAGFNGPWNFRLGCNPESRLIFGPTGVLYGTTSACGIGTGQGGGTAFALTGPPAGHTSWSTKLVYQFGANSADPTEPVSDEAVDPNGNVYGTGFSGGANGGGGIYRLSRGKYGWIESNIHQFAGPTGGQAGDGQNGVGLLWRKGTLYGTTAHGGAYGYGTVFAINRWNGPWVETVLHSFKGGPSDGAVPMAGLIADAYGQLYGTTSNGGSYNQGCPSTGCGTVYKLTWTGSTWRETVLYSFGSGWWDGAIPQGSLLLDSQGRLYGTCSSGGASYWGTAFMLTP